MRIVQRVGREPGLEGDPERRRKRRSAMASTFGLFSVKAMNQALNVEASKLRSEVALRSSLVARLRSVDDRAMSIRDFVPQVAAE